MTTTTVRLRALAMVLVATPGLWVGAWGTQAPRAARARVLTTVREALAVSDSGKFSVARRNLERSLAGCQSGAAGRECRLLYASGLGSLLYRQGSVDRRNRDSLYLGAVAYYDRILRESPDNREAIYGKALSYRALGPHEWMEPFFREVPNLDPGRRGLYFTFMGDYYAAEGRWSNAAAAYKQAAQQDPASEGARSGLIDALAAQGGQATHELLQYAQNWEVRYPGSAADAYGAILTASFGPDGRRDAVADSAVVGLVRAQTRTRTTVGQAPPAVSADWTPIREIQAFIKQPAPNAAPWWLEGADRKAALAQAALAAGRVSVSQGSYDVAEQLWTEGVRIARRSSTVSLDLERELAVLYFRQPALDPDRKKFDALEQDIFEGKFGALATGDLEAAQRFHTTLGLIYVARGAWTGPQAHNAAQQLTWALDKADERLHAQEFYQPLPELRQLLAHGLDSMGSHGQAGRRYLEAAFAFLDVDDLAGADSAVQNATRLGVDAGVPARVLTLRSAIAQPGKTAVGACAAERIATTTGPGTGNQAFFSRQRFKILADCSGVGPPSRMRANAIAAFRMVDSAEVTLVGGGDVARFERVMISLLEPFGVAFQPAHLDRSPASEGPTILVSLPGESAPLRDAAGFDDIIAARVIAELGSTTTPFPISVSAGVLSVPGRRGGIPGELKALTRVPGVREVRAREN